MTRRRLRNVRRFFVTLAAVLLPLCASARVAQALALARTTQSLGIMTDGVGSVAVGDLNNDGAPDIVVASGATGEILEAYLNDGAGGFQRLAATFPVTPDDNPLWNFGLVLADFDGDGWLDIATADAWRGANVYLNDRAGGFRWAQAILIPAVNEAKGVDAADVNQDGSIDLVIGGHNGVPDRGDRIYLNDGSGHFVDSGQKIGFDVTWAVAFGDLNNDGDPDYVSVNRYRIDPARIHVNDGYGFLETPRDLPTSGADDSYAVKVADLDADGLLDIVIANSGDPVSGTTSKIYRNLGSLSFQVTDDELGGPGVETKALAVADMTGDGWPDVVLGNWNQANTLCANDGAGAFADEEIGGMSITTVALAAADFDSDGRLDLVAGDASSDSYGVYLSSAETVPVNTPPAPPPALSSTRGPGRVRLSWTPGSDAATAQSGLTYNIRIGTGTGLNDVMSGGAAVGPGRFQTLFCDVSWLRPGTYYWSVQTVDAGLMASEWSPEATFSIRRKAPQAAFLNASPRTVARGSSVRFSGRVLPLQSSSRRLAHVQELTPQGWRTVKSVRLTEYGDFAVDYRDEQQGVRSYRLHMRRSAFLRAGNSPIRRVKWL